MPQEKEIVIHTDEVREILAATPKWIIRYGISVIFVLILLGISLCYFIKYPKILTADIKLRRVSSVMPGQIQQFMCAGALPVSSTNKLQIGQHVNIKLSKYPYRENGTLKGIISKISEAPNSDSCVIDIKISDGLLTSYNKTIIYKQEMNGKADIKTKNISIMERIFFKFRNPREEK